MKICRNSKFVCSKCGLCCEILDVERVLGPEYLDPVTGGCKYYDKENRLCKIYDSRPLICNVDGFCKTLEEGSRADFIKCQYECCDYLKKLFGREENKEEVD